MRRSLDKAVIHGFPSQAKAQQFPAETPHSASDARQLLEGLKPTSGNLVPAESWRRMLGGRKRYNHQRQQVALARREAVLAWLMENRMSIRSRSLGWLPTDRITVRHGDGAMLARALGLGKATICRDLSALQATHPALFGRQTIPVQYTEYMSFWRYARQAGLGNAQPDHNLRFAANQSGPVARTQNSVIRALGKNVYQPKPEPPTERVQRKGEAEETDGPQTKAEFLAMLDQNCPPQEPPARKTFRRSRATTASQEATA